MKWLWVLLVALNLLACAGVESEKKSKGLETDAAQVGVETDWLDVAVTETTATTCGVRDDAGQRTVWCWGSNSLGVMGTGGVTGAPVLVPERNLAPTGVVTLSAGHAHFVALTGEGRAYCWGNGYACNAGAGMRLTPVELPIP